MNEEAEKLKDKIYTFLEKKGIEKESQYFLLLSMVEELKEDIIEEDPEEPEEPEDEVEPDEFEDFEELNENELDPMETNEAKKYTNEVTTELKKPRSSHALKMKNLLKKKNDKSNKTNTE